MPRAASWSEFDIRVPLDATIALSCGTHNRQYNQCFASSPFDSGIRSGAWCRWTRMSVFDGKPLREIATIREVLHYFYKLTRLYAKETDNAMGK
jgi:hypothetical protein